MTGRALVETSTTHVARCASGVTPLNRPHKKPRPVKSDLGEVWGDTPLQEEIIYVYVFSLFL